MEIKPSNNWSILKIGPSSKRIKKRNKMSDVATSLSTKKYLDNLRRIQYDTKYYPVVIPFNRMDDKGNSNKPNTIDDEEDEESSDCESERKKNIIDALYSIMRRVDQISQKTQSNDQQMHENKVVKPNTTEQNLPKDCETVPSSQSLATPQCSTPNITSNYQKPQTPPTNTDKTPKEDIDRNVLNQTIPIPLASDDGFHELRTLLESPIGPPKKRYKHYIPEPIVRKTTGGVPMDLSYSTQNDANEKPLIVSSSETQSHQPSNSRENPVQTYLDINPQIPVRGEFSGGHSTSIQQAYPTCAENNTKVAVTSTLNLKSESSLSAQITQEKCVVANLDPIIPGQNTNQNTLIDSQTCLQPSQQYNEIPPHSQYPLIQGNMCNPESHPHIVAIFRQFYSQNNPNNANTGQHYSQSSSFVQPHSYLPQQGNFNEHFINPQIQGYPPEILYWAQIGMEMWARGNMAPVIPPVVNQPVQYIPCQVPSFEDQQPLQIAPDVDIEELNESVINNTLESHHLESDQNPTDQNILAETINELDSPPCMIDIPTETPTVTNYTERNHTIDSDQPKSTQNSESALNVTVNPGNIAAFVRELDDLLEKLKLSTKITNNQFISVSLFDNSEIMDKVMTGVHNYCTQRDTNDSASTSQGALVASRRVKKREHSNTSFDSSNDSWYDDDEKDQDYRIDSDEDNYNHKKTKRRRIKIMFDLPPEFDANDTRWSVKHRSKGLGIIEIKKNSNVYVNERQLNACKMIAKSSNALATKLLVEIFSYNALIVCSLTGGKATSYDVEDNKVRPGLDKNALETLLEYVEQHTKEVKWPEVSRQRILDSLRFKLKCIRAKARKFKNH